MPKTRIKKKTNTTGDFQDLGYTLTEDEITKITEIGNKAPNNHASTATTYGVATTSKYGHVKINNGDVNTVTSSNGVAAGMDHSHSNYVQTGREINGYPLTSDITLTASDVGALPSSTTIPTALSQLSADATHRTVTDTEKATWNSKSSFSGSYTDLTNKPTFPTVNNGTLTIQKNGAKVQTFTANQSTNVTANITVPTKTSDLTNDSGFITSADLPTGGGVTSVVGQTGAITANQIKTGIQNAQGGFAIGDGATTSSGGAIGKGASSSSGFAGGQNAVATNAGVAVGYGAYATAEDNVSGFSSVAIGVNAQARLGGSVQLGSGTNTTANTLQFRNTTIVNSDGDLVFPKTIEEIGVINEASSTTFSNSSGATSITKYRFIMLVSMRSDLWRAPFVIPTAYITQDYTRIYGIECWDGGRYRIRFDNDSKATITAAWYAGKVYVYGIK